MKGGKTFWMKGHIALIAFTTASHSADCTTTLCATGLQEVTPSILTSAGTFRSHCFGRPTSDRPTEAPTVLCIFVVDRADITKELMLVQRTLCCSSSASIYKSCVLHRYIHRYKWCPPPLPRSY